VSVSVLDRLLLRVQTDVSPEELQRMIDEALVAVEDFWGPPADSSNPITVTLPGGGRILDIGRPIDTAYSVAIQERYPYGYWFTGDVPVTLTSTDYRILNKGRTIERLPTGTNGAQRWGQEVAVSYVPVNDVDQRQEVAIKLVQLSLSYQAVNSKSIGDVNESYLDYQGERDKLLASLAPRKFSIA
jgi:hypothetical protein